MDMMQVGTSTAQVNKEARRHALIKIEMLFGERVYVLGMEAEWVHLRTELCGYEGYARIDHFVPAFEPTHRVCERAAVLYATPHFKNPLPCEPLYFNSRIAIEESHQSPEGLMYKVRGAGWVFASQACTIDYVAPDYVAECMKLLDARYGYERRGALIDCSTLVQAGCLAAGIACPYDVKAGMDGLGEAVEFTSGFSNLKRGDLVLWTEDKGSHVVIMVDGTNCLHATIADPYRKCLIQPLVEVIADQERDNNGPVTAVRRFSGYHSHLADSEIKG